jgi:uncharacterized protein with PQ loop repeat
VTPLWVELLGWANAVVGGAALVPQLVRLRRGAVAGVSASSWLFALVVFGAWASFSLALGLWPAVTFDSVCLVLGVAMVVALRDQLRSRWVLAAGVALVAVAAGAWVVPTLVGVFAATGSGVRAWPQVREAWRCEHTEGVSVTTWVFEAIAALGWFTYGLAVHQPLLGIYALGMTPMATAIVVRVLWRRSRTTAVAGGALMVPAPRDAGF